MMPSILPGNYKYECVCSAGVQVLGNGVKLWSMSIHWSHVQLWLVSDYRDLYCAVAVCHIQWRLGMAGLAAGLSWSGCYFGEFTVISAWFLYAVSKKSHCYFRVWNDTHSKSFFTSTETGKYSNSCHLLWPEQGMCIRQTDLKFRNNLTADFLTGCHCSDWVWCVWAE